MLKELSDSTVICLIRHGETDWNASGRLQGCEDIELNDAGREQAVELARYFQREPWDLIVSSPLKRAYVSAEIIASHLSVQNIIVVEGFRERNYGQASGLFPDERKSRFPDGKIPDQEDFEHLRVRAMEALTGIVRDHLGKRIIIVSHGAFINSILYTLSGGVFGSFKTRLRNACINRIVFNENHWSVEYYNKTAGELET